MNVLLTFTGFQDPYAKGLVGQEEQAGPILSLVSARDFDRIILFSTPATQKNTSDTKSALNRLHPRISVELRDVPLEDPTDYPAILKELRKHIGEIQEQLSDAEYYIAVTSGTPQMHACWVLLASGGEIPARLLNVRPPRFVTRDRPLISEIDLTSRDFPVVRSGHGEFGIREAVPADAATVKNQLGIVGDHPKMEKALQEAAVLAPSDSPVLICGETGTGKELLARFVHRMSGRPPEVFVPVNCAAIPEDLVESHLFGHKKGSFTGAYQDQLGKFDIANGGTLFLDEIGDLPLPAQAKLLRVLDDHCIEAIGDKKPRRVDARIIAATNRVLKKEVKRGRFRQDLFYRLAVAEIRLPPLRERQSDIPKIALVVLDSVNSTLRNPKRLSSEALKRLQTHSWPGNVRDLRNVIERSVRLAGGEVLEASDLLIDEPVTQADPLDALPDPHEGFSLDKFLSSVRNQLVLRAIEIAEGNQSKAARLLGITPQAVHKFLRRK